MKQFYEKVNIRSRCQMVDFLQNHFRYNTMNSWNASTSYANNIKIHNLELDRETQDKLYSLLDVDGFWSEIRWVLDDFGRQHNFCWQIGTNGRSGGYLVLYQGYAQLSEHKSYCTKCGQRNFASVKETGNVCGLCRNPSRIDYAKPPVQIGVYPGRSTDRNEDFYGWSLYELKKRVKLVQDFDKATYKLVAAAVNIANNYTVEEEEYFIPQTRKVLVEKFS